MPHLRQIERKPSELKQSDSESFNLRSSLRKMDESFTRKVNRQISNT